MYNLSVLFALCPGLKKIYIGKQNSLFCILTEIAAYVKIENGFHIALVFAIVHLTFADCRSL